MRPRLPNRLLLYGTQLQHNHTAIRLESSNTTPVQPPSSYSPWLRGMGWEGWGLFLGSAFSCCRSPPLSSKFHICFLYICTYYQMPSIISDVITFISPKLLECLLMSPKSILNLFYFFYPFLFCLYTSDLTKYIFVW